MSDGDVMEDEPLVPDLSSLRERFKGRCTPEYGQLFDLETGVEQQKIITKDDPIDVVVRHERELFLVSPPGPLGGRLRWPNPPDGENDATRFGRHVGPRVTSLYSNHSLEHCEYDSVEPMAHTVGWVRAMAREEWSDMTNHYVENRNGRRPEIRIRGCERVDSDD
jgi:hypothetical protein